MTKNGIGVGHGLSGELLTELRVLLNTECGHCGGPTCAPEDALPPLLEERPFKQGIFDQPLTSLHDMPVNKYVNQSVLCWWRQFRSMNCTQWFDRTRLDSFTTLALACITLRYWWNSNYRDKSILYHIRVVVGPLSRWEWTTPLSRINDELERDDETESYFIDSIIMWNVRLLSVLIKVNNNITECQQQIKQTMRQKIISQDNIMMVNI